MAALLSNATSALILILPWPLFIAGLVAALGADKFPQLMKKMTTGAAGVALACALLAAVTYLVRMSSSTSYVIMRNLPEGLGTLGISPDINSFTILMLILVALVGLVVTRYASTYLDGDFREGRFHQWLSLALGSFLLMMACGNMWTFLILWIASSLCLHQLLAFYRDRPGAVLTARKKYLLDRIADVSLFSAIVLVTRTLHSSQFASIAPELSRMHGALPNTLQIASALLVISAVLKSAQFPFHGWLIQVMEAPTPVSALLHAGIIYTGAFLLLRMVPLMSRVIWTGDTVVVIGLCSVFSGSLMMMTATNIKGALAYSTYAQMGFMLMEWGLGLYSLAVLHIVSHAVYKAHAFLSSGSVVDHFRAPMLPTKRPGRIMGPIISSLAIAGLIVIGTEAGFGMLLPQRHSLLVMGAILGLAITQLVSQVWNKGQIGGQRFLWIVVGLSVLATVAYFALDTLFIVRFSSLWPATVHQPPSIIQNGLLVLVFAVFAILLLVQQFVPRFLNNPLWQAIYVHLYNNLYIDAVFTQWVRRLGRGHMQQTSQAIRPSQSPEVISS